LPLLGVFSLLQRLGQWRVGYLCRGCADECLPQKSETRRGAGGTGSKMLKAVKAKRHFERLLSDASLRGGVERAAISRAMRCTVPVPTPSSRATLLMPLPPRNCSWMRFSTFSLMRGRPSVLTFNERRSHHATPPQLGHSMT